MKYGTEGERQMMEDTQRRTGERAGRQHKGKPMNWRQINWEARDERQVKTHKRHPDSRTPLDSMGDK